MYFTKYNKYGRASCEFLINGSSVDGTTISLSNQNYCVPNDVSNEDIYCTHNYIECTYDVCNNSDHSTCNSIEGCNIRRISDMYIRRFKRCYRLIIN